MKKSLLGNRLDIEERAYESRGTSCEPLYRLGACVVGDRRRTGGVLVDVGCGTGRFWDYVRQYVDEYVGVDVVRYEGFPQDIRTRFEKVDLETGRIDFPDAFADVVASLETIEHVENPRAFFRELTRLVKPGGLIIVSTPNQLSFLSKISLLVKNQYPAFQEAPGCYPAHISPLLEIDLLRIARECGLADIKIRYTDCGRIPGTDRHWPRLLGFHGRAFSDNLLLEARKP